MREDCRHYESRTYGDEVVRKCRLDCAPEAPWRCPAECPSFEKRMIDVGWQYGSLAKAYENPEPEPQGEDIAALLDAAEDIVNSAAPAILTEFERKPRGMFGRKPRQRKRK